MPEHAELAWVFNCVARIGWLNRMTQFKEKAGKDRENASVGLYAYPTLMAADILVYRATHVPVGDDQKQHLELSRDIAQKFNNDFAASIAAHGFGDAFFPLPEPLIQGPATRVMSLRDGAKKMSKSDPSDYSRINLTDDADAIAQKIRKAKTDPEPLPGEEAGLEHRPEADNLVGIYAALDGRGQGRRAARVRRGAVLGLQGGARRPRGRQARADRRRDAAPQADPGHIDAVLADGAERAQRPGARRPWTPSRTSSASSRRPSVTPGHSAATCAPAPGSMHDAAAAEGHGVETMPKRRSYEAGHRPKFLVVVDETPECEPRDLFRRPPGRAHRGGLMMLAVIEPPEVPAWFGVGDAMRAEAEAEALERLEAAAAQARERCRGRARAGRCGRRQGRAIAALIEEDEDISFLVLAAGTGKEGPGPLVTTSPARRPATFPVPIAIVPGDSRTRRSTRSPGEAEAEWRRSASEHSTLTKRHILARNRAIARPVRAGLEPAVRKSERCSSRPKPRRIRRP